MGQEAEAGLPGFQLGHWLALDRTVLYQAEPPVPAAAPDPSGWAAVRPEKEG